MQGTDGVESPPAFQRHQAARAILVQQAPGELPLDVVLAEKLEGLPKDVGIALMVLGAAGIVIPGTIPPGISFVFLGAALVWPRLLAPIGRCAAKRFQWTVRVLIGFADHLRIDLNRRYP